MEKFLYPCPRCNRDNAVSIENRDCFECWTHVEFESGQRSANVAGVICAVFGLLAAIGAVAVVFFYGPPWFTIGG